RGVIWVMAAARPDGRPFTPGRYRFEIEMGDIRSALTTVTGEPPSNVVMGQWRSGVARGHVDLVLTAPSTPGGGRHNVRASKPGVAFDRRQFDEAAPTSTAIRIRLSHERVA